MTTRALQDLEIADNARPAIDSHATVRTYIHSFFGYDSSALETQVTDRPSFNFQLSFTMSFFNSIG